jgi:hypothetical protein
METLYKTAIKENPSKSHSINATKLNANFKGINSLADISRKKRKKEASKPLYLARYE